MEDAISKDELIRKKMQKNARNINLHKEFDDVKIKIQQLEDKNDRIIEKIHEACNFKKKYKPLPLEEEPEIYQPWIVHFDRT
jgi:hypothetical protein